MVAATEIMAGKSNVVIAGGMESMSQAPHFIRGQGVVMKFHLQN